MENLESTSSMVPYLPLEVMTEILVKLSVRTLLRFRVVCKLWCSLISSEHFVRRHLSSSASNTQSQRIIMNPSGLLYVWRYHSVNGSRVLDESSIDIRIFGRLNWLCVMGSCDGLICLKEVGETGTILLWNPSTRDFKVLPSTSEVGIPEVGGSDQPRRYGFGYDYNSDDYKVLIIYTLDKPNIQEGVQFPVVDFFKRSYKSIIYSLRSNSWRRTQDYSLGFRILSSASQSVFASGALHWKVVKIGWMGAILSFDLTSETYKEVALPVSECDGFQLEVGASRGCLCVCLRVDDDDGGSYDIWVMKEYGVRESWTKTIKIPKSYLEATRLKPLTWFMENGEILMYACGHLDHPVSYNADKYSLLHFDKVYHSHKPNPAGYVESLVSPNAHSNLGADEVGRLNVRILHGEVATMAYGRPSFKALLSKISRVGLK